MRRNPVVVTVLATVAFLFLTSISYQPLKTVVRQMAAPSVTESPATESPLTLVYKHVEDLPIYLDLYTPLVPQDRPIPVVVYFHGGGLTVGNRKSWFPKWLYRESRNDILLF
jgi:acetyl esterase/lipase